jgi:hypothetical protein
VLGLVSVASVMLGEQAAVVSSSRLRSCDRLDASAAGLLSYRLAGHVDCTAGFVCTTQLVQLCAPVDLLC